MSQIAGIHDLPLSTGEGPWWNGGGREAVRMRRGSSVAEIRCQTCQPHGGGPYELSGSGTGSGERRDDTGIHKGPRKFRIPGEPDRRCGVGWRSTCVVGRLNED